MEPEAAIRVLTKMFQVAGYASADADEVFRNVSENVVDLLDACACIFIRCDDKGHAGVAASVSRTKPDEAAALTGKAIPCCRVIEEGIAYWTESGAPDCSLDHFGTICPGAHLCIPLLSREGASGALSVGFESSHEFTKEEIDVYLAIAGAVAAAIENANLYKTVQDYALKLEKRVRDRTQELMLLYTSSRALTPTSSMATVYESVTEQLAKVTDSASAVLLDMSGSTLLPYAPYGSVNTDDLASNAHELSHLAQMNWVRPSKLDSTIGEAWPLLQKVMGGTVLAVPLTENYQLLALVLLARDASIPYTDRELRITGALAQQASLAVAVTREHEHDRKIAEAFQRSLLPPAVYKVDGLQIAGIYQPAKDEANVGGDVYDVWSISDNRLAVFIGDISGKGLKAAVNAATLKYSLRAYSELGDGPATIISRTNNALQRLGDDGTFSTLFYAEFDQSSGEITYTNAGHEPPLLIDLASGSVIPLMVNGPAVGIVGNIKYTETRIGLPENHAFVMVTDGITEAPKSAGNLEQDHIVQAVLAADCSDPASVAACIFRLAVDSAHGKLHDDAAVVVVVRGEKQ